MAHLRQEERIPSGETVRALWLCLLLSACGGGGGGGGSSTPAAPTLYEADNAPPASYTAAPVVLFMGDSVTARWHVEQCVPGAFNFGVGGQTSVDMLARFNADIIAPAPAPGSTVIIDAGGNDIAKFSNPSITDVAAMAAAAQQHGLKVVLTTVIPFDYWFPGGIQSSTDYAGHQQILTDHMAEWNDSIRALAAQQHYGLVDYYPLFTWPTSGLPVDTMYVDGLHPSLTGYAVMCSTLLGALQ